MCGVNQSAETFQKLPDEGITHALCTSGCGVRPGAPIATKSSLGAYELVGIVAGGAPCTKRAMRRRLNDDPPLYIDVYPYMAWIINVITAYIIPGAYPQNFMLASSGNGGKIWSFQSIAGRPFSRYEDKPCLQRHHSARFNLGRAKFDLNHHHRRLFLNIAAKTSTGPL